MTDRVVVSSLCEGRRNVEDFGTNRGSSKFIESCFASEIMSEAVREATEDFNFFFVAFSIEVDMQVAAGCERIPLSKAALYFLQSSFGNSII